VPQHWRSNRGDKKENGQHSVKGSSLSYDLLIKAFTNQHGDDECA
jgi:hypothetical protein